MNRLRSGCLTNLFLLNLALLFTHEIDSAYWHEWELFGIPGGIQTFLALNLILILFGLWGFTIYAGEGRTGLGFSLAVALAGVFAGCIHTYFILRGHPQFQTPASLALLAAILVVSGLQAVLTVAAMRDTTRGAGTRGAIKVASTGGTFRGDTR